MNSSLWHVKLSGITDYKTVKSGLDYLQEVKYLYLIFFCCIKNLFIYICILKQYKERETVRLCLKHFRKYQKLEIVDTIKRITGIDVEDPQLSALYDLLVVKGDHDQAEQFIANAIKSWSIFFKFQYKIEKLDLLMISIIKNF